MFFKGGNTLKQESLQKDIGAAYALNDLGDVPTRILAVGDAEEWLRAGQPLPADREVAFVSFHEIDAKLMADLAPGVVLSPLLATGFDCIDLAELLVTVEYRGRYRAVAVRLPNPELVVREIRQLCPSLDFDILMAD